MKNWLEQKVLEQQSLFDNLMLQTVAHIAKFNAENNDSISVKVLFSHDTWLDSGNADITVFRESEDENIEEYCHSVHNQTKDVMPYKIVSKLMSEGLFSNNWFSVLEQSRSYDAVIVFFNEGYESLHDSADFREKRKKEKYIGFNIAQKKKNSTLKK